MAGVRFEGVTKRFGETTVIDSIDITIEDGELAVFVGPSGCGKSTLLRMLAGLEPVTSGHILIGDEVVDGRQPRERDIAMVFQSYALYPHMTVEQNIGFPLRMMGVPRAERRRRVEAAATLLELTPFLDRYPRQLSGGQRQRVAMGRAIVRDPAVFLFDEPLSNLDAALRLQMRLEIARLHGEIAATMVYVTHDQVEAMTLADRIVVLRDGKVEQVGSPRALYMAPRTRFVAGFIGAPQMNFLDVRLEPTGEASALARIGGTSVPVRLARPVRENTPASLGIRPEALRPGGGGPLSMSARVRQVEYLGSTLYLHLDLDDGDGAGSIVAAAPPNQVVHSGDRVEVSFSPDDVHLFDADTLRLSANDAGAP
jgi:ABC-type sugar transport system ATPase subunit